MIWIALGSQSNLPSHRRHWCGAVMTHPRGHSQEALGLWDMTQQETTRVTG